MRTLVKTALLGLILSFASQAGAVIISDFVNIREVNNAYLLLKEGQSYTVTHNISDNGVPDLNQVDSAWLRLGFADDWRDFWFESEVALVSGSGILGSFEVDGSILSYDIRYLGVGADGVDDLNADGLIEVTVASKDLWWGKGDFYWKTSELFADISPVNVNEPATLIMLGIGLLGLRLVRRKKTG